MPTVMLTTHCPNACPWCFARPKMEEYQARGIREMSWDDFVIVVDFYERSGLRQMILLGGEPGLHSRFTDILHLLGRKKFLGPGEHNGHPAGVSGGPDSGKRVFNS